jgi:ABC-type Fe3+ transport system substrate-binding protein
MGEIMPYDLLIRKRRIVEVYMKVIAYWLLLSFSLFAATAFCAESASLQKAKKEAEAKGLIFLASRDEIVAKAKKEGKVAVGSTLEVETYKPMVESFKKKYPFIDAKMEELSGSVYGEKFLTELAAGKPPDWDIVHAPEDFYARFVENAMKFDLLGMAQSGVLAINPKMVNPEYRTVMAVGSGICAMSYNKEAIPPDRVPNTWEDFLKPELKGKKFVVDIRPYCISALAVEFGDEWVKNYAAKLKDQQPIWARGQTRALTSIIAGEYALHQAGNYHSCVRAQQKDPRKVLVCKPIEPVPVRLHENDFVIRTARHRYAALLFLEHQASPEGQKILDEVEPLKSSLYADGEISRIVRGKKIALNDFRTHQESARRMRMVLEGFGFPKAEIK